MKSVDVTAGTIEYREEGDPSGPPVVLLHGLLMNDAQWDLALPLLPEGRLQQIDDAYVLVMLDKPEQTARAIGEFLTA